MLVATEPQDEGQAVLGPFLFEATSAFGTCGLSMGVTPELGAPSRIALIFAMFVGRVGILAFAASLVSVAAARRSYATYPSENVVIY